MNQSRILIVLPAYNAEKTLKSTIQSIPVAIHAETLLVDDASTDQTCELAKNLDLRVIKHSKNLGYGGNQKTCYTEALETEAEIIVMIHPDYQYDSRIIPALILPIQLGICDIMLGNRIRSREEALEGGMPYYKYLSNRFLTILENLILGQNLGEFHSGMRAYSRKVLETIPWNNNSNDFVFDQQFLIQSTFFGFKMGDVPVPAKYFKEASSINFFRSLKYGFQTCVTLLTYCMAKWIGIKTQIYHQKTIHND